MNSINELIKKWQKKLKLTDWSIGYKFVVFHRKDNFPQKGDIKVNINKKSATVLLLKDRKDYSNTILHELIHLLLWDYDSYTEKNISKDKKDKYFEKLEKTVASLTEIIWNSR